MNENKARCTAEIAEKSKGWRAVWKPMALLVVIYMAFVSLGLPDGVLGLAWPSMRSMTKN